MLEGTAYGRSAPHSFDNLTAVGPGTPMGELLRRYWQPVGLSRDASSTPRQITFLGEDLVLFRDGRGRPGLLYPRCMHRGTTLYYGKVEDEGIRCCYHGWMFAVDGTCLDQPCEPGGGQHRDNARQPWYPLREEYGMLFAYMGPPDKRPAFPRFRMFENLRPGEKVAADDTSIGSGGGAIVPCNWLQAFENVCDPFHVPILHGSISGLQFTDVLSGMPTCRFDHTERGVRITQDRDKGEGRIFRRITEAMLPNIRVVPHPRPDVFEPCTKIGWVVPIDDRTHRIYSLARVQGDVDLAYELRQTFNGRSWFELSEAEHRDMPGDYEAQVGQGPISAHSEEHLATSDLGIVMLRRRFRDQLKTLAEGGDLANVSYDGDEMFIGVDAGNFMIEPQRDGVLAPTGAT